MQLHTGGITAVSYALLFLYAAPRLTTEKLERARELGVATKQAAETGSNPETASGAIAERGTLGAPPPIDEEEI